MTIGTSDGRVYDDEMSALLDIPSKGMAKHEWKKELDRYMRNNLGEVPKLSDKFTLKDLKDINANHEWIMMRDGLESWIHNILIGREYANTSASSEDD